MLFRFCIINLFIFLYMEKTSVFTTPLPLVYAKEKKMEFVSALDLSRLDTLVGIKLDEITLSLKQSKVSWYDAYWIIERNKTLWKTPCLPEENDCQELVRYKELINATLEILREHGVDADLLDYNGIYWLQTEFSHVKSYAFLFKERLNTLRDKFDASSCYARVIWYN